jgi:hypothetical protein
MPSRRRSSTGCTRCSTNRSGPRPTKGSRRAPDAIRVHPRVVLLLIAALCLASAAWAAARARGPAAPDAGEPVVVGEARVGAAALEAAASRAANGRPARLAAARRTAADRAIERLWLQGEATARGLRPAADLPQLRAQVADALAGLRPLPPPARFAAAFDDFHERWRARTRCLPAYRDPYEDRCGDVATTEASCRWMGEATLCALRPGVGRRWLVVVPGGSGASPPSRHDEAPAPATDAVVLRRRSRAAAVAVARAVYSAARARRERAAARAGEAARREAERARVAREREARRRDPRLAGPVLAAAQDACRRQLRESDPYLFGFGMQDVVGQAEGLIAVRTAFAERLGAAARDDIDRDKLRPLLDAVEAGSRELARMAAAEPGEVAALVARFDARTEPERAISRRLGLGDCLVRPAR